MYEYGIADLKESSNNGVVMVWPTPEGRLSHLVQEVRLREKYVDHRGWVFRSFHVNEDGTHDYTTRGLSAGTREDLESFIAMCRELGLRVKNGAPGTGYIPMSNGKQVLAERPGGESYIFGYSDLEVMLCRVDLPTREELTALCSI